METSPVSVTAFKASRWCLYPDSHKPCWNYTTMALIPYVSAEVISTNWTKDLSLVYTL